MPESWFFITINTHTRRSDAPGIERALHGIIMRQFPRKDTLYSVISFLDVEKQNYVQLADVEATIFSSTVEVAPTTQQVHAHFVVRFTWDDSNLRLIMSNSNDDGERRISLNKALQDWFSARIGKRCYARASLTGEGRWSNYIERSGKPRERLLAARAVHDFRTPEL